MITKNMSVMLQMIGLIRSCGVVLDPSRAPEILFASDLYIYSTCTIRGVPLWAFIGGKNVIPLNQAIVSNTYYRASIRVPSCSRAGK